MPGKILKIDNRRGFYALLALSLSSTCFTQHLAVNGKPHLYRKRSPRRGELPSKTYHCLRADDPGICVPAPANWQGMYV